VPTHVAWPRLTAVLALLAILPSCGGGSTGPNPPPAATPTPSLAPFVIFQSAFPPLDPGDFAYGDFTISAPGTVRATMDWTFPSNQMFLFVFSGTTCTEQDFITFINTGPVGACTMLASDLEPATKPGLATFNATAAGGARVVVLNLGPTGESGTVQITLAR
jgi:hypothetical protein